jgi:predicted neutral ceramidase superfamily lipid hydrolase
MKTVKKILSLAATALPHINIALGVVLLTLLVTDRYNRAMNFINNDITKGLLTVFCILVVIESVIYSYRQRKGK